MSGDKTEPAQVDKPLDTPVEAPVSDAKPAGKVLALEGTASAARPDLDPRVLAVGEPVYADDTVRTELDGRVELLLAHNGARYGLGPKRKVRLDQSIAWRAKQLESGHFDNVALLKSAAAGRNTERQGADGVATLSDGNVGDETDEEEGGTGVRPKEGRRNDQYQDEPSKSSTPPRYGLIGGSLLERKGKTGAGKGSGTGSKTDTKTSPAQVQGGFVLKLAKTCQTEHAGEGAFYITLSVEELRVSEIVTLGPESLEATLQCLKEKLRSAKMPNDESVTGTLSL